MFRVIMSKHWYTTAFSCPLAYLHLLDMVHKFFNDLALWSPLQPVLLLSPQALQSRNKGPMLLFLTARHSPFLRTLLSLFQQLSTPKFTHATEYLSALPTSNTMITLSHALSGFTCLSPADYGGPCNTYSTVHLSSPAWIRVLITGP